jgi:hypothetical protein
MRQSLHEIFSKTKKNDTFRYIDDVLSINNPNFANWVPVIYPQKLEIK